MGVIGGAVKRLGILIISLFISSVVMAIETGQTHVELVSQDITGTVYMPDGQTPMENIPIRVWDIDAKKMTYRGKTDANGSFSVPLLKAGNSYIFVGRVKISVKMFSSGEGLLTQSHDLIVVLPRPMLATSSGIMPVGRLFDVMLAPALMQPPDPPRIVSP